MLVSDIVTSTAVKVKEISTNIFGRFAKNMRDKEYIQRNRKIIVTCLACWLAVILIGYLVHHSAAGRARESLYQQGMAAAADLAANGAQLILEKELLELTVKIRTLENIDSLNFAVITDHNDTILAQAGASTKAGK